MAERIEKHIEQSEGTYFENPCQWTKNDPLSKFYHFILLLTFPGREKVFKRDELLSLSSVLQDNPTKNIFSRNIYTTMISNVWNTTKR